jgi:glyoxylase-like metal-dependent hydrolase (beta-lactamase superfamily II)
VSAGGRREFLRVSGGCAAHLAFMGAGLSTPARARWGTESRFRTVAAEPWGRLEQVAEGIWAMVSTPLTGDRTTLCNGGLIAGRDGVLMVEAFASDAGATWMARQAHALTGRAPTHVVVTHYHSDHTGGLRAACARGTTGAAGPVPGAALHATAATRELTSTRNQGAATDLLADAVLVDPVMGGSIDLGGRRITLAPHDGHTPSDVSVRVEDSPVLFCGDLVWNGMFPNFVDALPSRLARSVRALRASGATAFVPGHGTVATVEAMDRYLALLDSVEVASRRAVERGITAEVAGAEYKVPAELGEWMLFNPRYYERAIGAWMKELQPGR